MQNRMFARILAGVCALSTLGATLTMTSPANAANPNKAANQALTAQIKAAPKYHGKIVSIDTKKSTITIQQKKMPAMTFTVTSATRIRLDKAKTTLAALTPGLEATVRSTDKVTALQISAHDKNATTTTPNTPAPAATPGA